MKTSKTLLTFLLIIFVLSCEKNNVIDDDKNITEDQLIKKSEAHFQLKSAQTIYTDNSGNKYYTLNFNPDTLEHVYSVYFEEGKKYYLTIAGDQAYPVQMNLITSSNDTLFYGETVDIPRIKKYIVWESNISDTLFIAVAYTEDINFHTYYFQLTFEELSIHKIYWNDLTFECSGDWFINHENTIALACHNTSYTKWARIVDNTLFNYEFSYKVSLKSGIPDIYTGIAFTANDEMQEMFNMPDNCYEFKIVGPAAWETWVWSEGGMGRYWGETTTSLNRGEGAWNELQINMDNDYAELHVNAEQVDSFRNIQFMDNGLYITVSDEKEDTVYFKDIRLIK